MQRARQALLEPTDALSVQLTLDVDAPQITRPYDGTDQVTSVDEYLNWYTAHVLEVESKIDQGKNGVRALLNDNGATISSDPRALPVIVARIPVNVLRSEELNRLVINIEDPVESGVILGHAGRASMNAGALVGGGCGAGTCDGGNVIVGLWERDSSVTVVSGIAFNNTRLSTAGSAYSYLLNPATCAAQADCSDPGHPDVSRYCEPAVTSQACNLSLSCPLGQTCNAQHHCQYLQGRCVQDHLSWVAASVGMSGDYSYNTTWPGAADPTPNVPSGTLITASSPAHVQFKVGNDTSINGFDYVVSTSGGAAAPFVNESMSTTGGFLDWAGRAYGAFFAAAGGNVGGTDIVTCSQLRNGLCVGWYDYNTYNSVSSHRRTQNAAFGSNFINSPAVNVERPHLLGPGNHTGGNDGIHMPRIDATPGTNAMEWAYLPQAGGSPIAIAGSSFASPAVLSAAIQALQYEGWLSALAFPMVNKAVLLASTEDANADGAIGNTTRWSGQPSDAEDGAGQLNFTYIKQTLDNNQYYWDDVADSDFVSCGTNCRKITIPITIPIAKSARIALAWQSCMTAETGVPVITNDLDLVLNCGNPMVVCGGLYQSVSTADEIEMVQYPACNFLTPGCAIEVRIKNGAALQSCGSTTTERIGVAWALRP